MDIDAGLRFVRENHHGDPCDPAARRLARRCRRSPCGVDADGQGRDQHPRDCDEGEEPPPRSAACRCACSPTRSTARGCSSTAPPRSSRCPEAMDGLVDYYRRLSGEHPDWDEYRAAMQRERRCLIRITVTRAGPDQSRLNSALADCPARVRESRLEASISNRGKGSMMQIGMTVNGAAQEHDVEPRTLLVQYLREACGLTGTKIGCDTSSCGACTVLLDGESVKSCTMFAAQADGASITTIEGLAPTETAAPRAAGVPRAPRPAVRLLHRGDGDGGGLVPRGEPEPDRARRAARPRRQPLPLHRLPQHREGRARRGRERWAASDDRRPRSVRRARASSRCARRTRRCSPARPGSSTTSTSRARCTVRIVRSPVAHAADRARSTRAAAAAMPGVVAVLTGADLARRRSTNAVAVRVARHRRHEASRPLAAGDRRRSALRRATVSRSSSPRRAKRPRTRPKPSSSTTTSCRSILDLEIGRRRRRRSCTPTSARTSRTRGNSIPDPAAVDAAFANAAHTVKERYLQQRLIPMAMEPRGVA